MNNIVKTVVLCCVVLVAAVTIFAVLDRPKELELGVPQEVTAMQLKTEGNFPEWLHGELIRNSAVPVFCEGEQVSHPWDGLAMLHSFSIENNKVYYSNSFLPSQAYEDVVNKGRPDYRGIVAEPTLWHQFIELFSTSSNAVKNASVNICRYGKDTVALTEVPLSVSFDRKSAKTIGNYQYDDALPVNSIWVSPHPHRNEESNVIYNIMIEFGHPSHYVLYKIKDGSSKREVIAKLPVETPAYMHSFSMTEHYFVLTEYPLIMPASYLQTPGKPFLETFCDWDKAKNTHFIIVDKSTGNVVLQADVDPFFSYHHANAYETSDGKEIVLDLVAYPQYSGSKKETSAPNWSRRLLRHRVSLAAHQVSTEIMLEKEVEFPRINERHDGKQYRYLYAIMRGSDETKGITKFDTETKTYIEWKVPGYSAIEPVFVPNPNSDKEDDGIVLTVINSEQEKKGFLVALDGVHLKEIARAEMPWMLPTTFHGQFFSESDFVFAK